MAIEEEVEKVRGPCPLKSTRIEIESFRMATIFRTGTRAKFEELNMDLSGRP